MAENSNGPVVVRAGAAKSVATDPAYSSNPQRDKGPDHTVAAVLDLLAERWPQTFAIYEMRRQPLKVGIFGELLAALNGAVAPDELRAALRCYTLNPVYLKKLRKGAARVDLAGQPAGVVTEAQCEFAQLQLSNMTREVVKARAAGRAPPAMRRPRLSLPTKEKEPWAKT